MDGFLTVTCVKANGMCEGPNTYSVQREGPKFTIWKSGDKKQKPYIVTLVPGGYKCSCRSRVNCKHGDGITELINRQLI